MNITQAAESAVRTVYAWARHQLPHQDVIVALHLGNETSALAFGEGAQTEQVSLLPLGLQTLSDRYFPGGRLDALSIEHAIVAVEDIVMPWHKKLPANARLCTADISIIQLAQWAGMTHQNAPWLLTTEAVEELFNRWSALAQGRPASQDALPTQGLFSVSLLVLREWLHHLAFKGITILPMAPTVRSLNQSEPRL